MTGQDISALKTTDAQGKNEAAAKLIVENDNYLDGVAMKVKKFRRRKRSKLKSTGSSN